jgi:hypothetical protein
MRKVEVRGGESGVLVVHNLVNYDMSRIPFDQEESLRWFGDNLYCWWCEQNGWNSRHHIRSGKYNNSLCNLAPLHNHECHIQIHNILKKKENVKMLLQKTITYLLSKGYILTENDKLFIAENSEFYCKD